MTGFEEAMKDVKDMMNNKNTLSEEQVANHWEAGDPCGEKGCDHEVHRRDHPRRNGEIPRHPDAPETEFICTHHGIVAKR